MKKIGMIFPGQGSQHLGMCKDLYDRERIVQELFEEASSCLDTNFVRLCFASSEKELRETINAQTSIFLASAAIYSLLHKKYGITPSIVAGHSSGEFAAMFAAGGMNFPDALYLLKKRALFMDEATKAFPGSMIAVLGLPHDTVARICREYDDAAELVDVAEVVNYNAPTQVVVSGSLESLDKVRGDVIAAGGKVVALNVAGAFHSRLMQQASKQFSQYMVKVDFKDLQFPLVNNVEAKEITGNEELKNSLVKHMESHVLWWPSMEHLRDCDIILEVGPGNKYSKMLKREWPDKEILSVSNLEDVENLLTILDIPFEHAPLEDDELALTPAVKAKPSVAEPEVTMMPQPEHESSAEQQP